MNKTEINIDRLFGKDRGQEDENLSKYFIKTNQYNSIYEGNRELVLGRKGSGKSSLFYYLSQELPKKSIIPITISPSGEDFAHVENNLSRYKDMKFNDDFKYSLAWYELIVTEIAFSVLSEKNHHFLKGTNETLYKYIKKNEKIKGDFVSQFSNAVLKAFSGGKVTLANVELNIDFSSFSEIVNPDQAEIKKALSKTITDNKFFVLVDNLDEPWKNTEQMNCWLRGLILASRRLKRDFNNLKIVIFLRDDIYNEIVKGCDIFDSRSEIITLNWKDSDNYSLRKLLAARIAYYFDEPYPNDLKEFDKLLTRIYPLQIGRRNSMVYTTKFVCDRTFYKPREFLQFFRNALEISFSETLPIPQGAIDSAEREYSSWKISFLEGEYSKTYKNISNCLDTFAGLTRNWLIDYDSLIKHLENLNADNKIFNIIDNSVLTSKQTADFLFCIGFLRKVTSSYNKKTFITYVDEPNPRIIGANLDIHPAFRKNLSKRQY